MSQEHLPALALQELEDGQELVSQSRRATFVFAGILALGIPSRCASADSRGFVLAQPERGGLTARWLEQLRVALQDEADAVQYGGELAPGGPPPALPALFLIPIVQMQSTLKGCKPSVLDASRWPALIELLTTGPFAVKEFKRIFNAYADNIYYSSGSSEANAYLLGGATPSTRQTNQYLLRNEALKQIGELVDELEYQLKQPADQRETDVALEYLDNALAVFDEYLSLASADDLKIALPQMSARR